MSGFEVAGILPFNPADIPEHTFSVSQRKVSDEEGELKSERRSPQ
jgi:hypothetical protein